MEICSVFEDMNLIRGAWISEMTEKQILACKGNKEFCTKMDELVQTEFKNMLTIHAHDIKIGLIEVNDLLELSAGYIVKLNEQEIE